MCIRIGSGTSFGENQTVDGQTHESDANKNSRKSECLVGWLWFVIYARLRQATVLSSSVTYFSEIAFACSEKHLSRLVALLE